MSRLRKPIDGPQFELYSDLTYWKKSTYEKLKRDHNDSSLIYIPDDSDQEQEPEDKLGLEVFVVKKPKTHPETIVIDDSPTKDVRTTLCKSKKRKMKNDFIIDEAEVCVIEEDEEESQFNSTQDGNLSGFVIDDDEVVECGPSQYLRSVNDMVGGHERNKFKLKFDYNRSMNGYSQAVLPLECEEEDEYEMDSFCDDQIIYDDSASPSPEKSGDLTSSLKLRSKKSINRSKQSSTPHKVEIPKKKRFKRIILESP